MSYDPQRAPLGFRLAYGFRLLREDDVLQWRVRIKVVPWPVPERDCRFTHEARKRGISNKITDEGREASILLERDRVDAHVAAVKAEETRQQERLDAVARRVREAEERAEEAWRIRNYVRRAQPLKQPLIPGTKRAWEWFTEEARRMRAQQAEDRMR